MTQKFTFDLETSLSNEDSLSYLEELYIALSGVMLYGEEGLIGKEA